MKHPQRPLYDRVILQRLEEPEQKGRLVQVVSKEKPMRAKVIAVGPGRWPDNCGQEQDKAGRLPMSVQPGDIVLIGKYSGTVYEEVGEDLRTTEYVIVREEDILTVFEKEMSSGKG